MNRRGASGAERQRGSSALIGHWAPRRFGLRLVLGLLLVFAAVLAFSACEEPDTSFQTSPSMLAFMGTTTGSVVLNPPDSPPAPKTPPSDWGVELGNATFSHLDNGTPSLQVVLQVEARPGAGLELWLTRDADHHTVARWTGGSSTTYSGTICFQLVTVGKTEALPLTPGKYTFTADFVDAETGVIASRAVGVTNQPPTSNLPPPGPNSTVFSVVYACPRGN